MKYFLSILLFLICFVGKTQQLQHFLDTSSTFIESIKPLQTKQRICICCNADTTRKPLIVLNKKVLTDDKGLNAVNPKEIASINLIAPLKAVRKYGKRAEYGVIIITTK